MRAECAVLLLLTLGSLGCGQERDPDPGNAAEERDSGSTQQVNHAGRDSDATTHTQSELYEARGTLLWYEPGRVYLNHEEMPGFMDAMSMGFDVRDPALLDGIDPGTSVEFRVVVEGESFYIDQIYPLEE
ncbi:MAG: hypothetical protein BMS9Abin37_1623 [Acidobacteriota bacterium]|nr:MAG: hypothetical protein BMS9Abin37_1623 [Acidobacteriota bacterium]